MSNEIRTAISGVSSGPEAELRQEALAILKELRAANPTKRLFLDLVPEPENPYDPDAIKLMCDIPELGGRVQLGYVKNSQCRCKFCEAQHERFPRDNRCPRCKQANSLERCGVATKIAGMLRRDASLRFYAEITEVTGGEGAKANYGCNIRIASVFQRKSASVPAATTGREAPPREAPPLPTPPPPRQRELVGAGARSASASRRERPAAPSKNRVYDFDE